MHYQVQVTLTNTVAEDAVGGLTDYVTGGGIFGVPIGSLMLDVYTYAPEGVSALGGTVGAKELEWQDATHLGRSVARFRILLGPGETKLVTLDFIGDPTEFVADGLHVTPGVGPVEQVYPEVDCGAVVTEK
jgi:hypothetical protein